MSKSKLEELFEASSNLDFAVNTNAKYSQLHDCAKDVVEKLVEMNDLRPSLAFHAYHGRRSVDEDMNDWGFEGPKLYGVDYFIITYMQTFRLSFLTDEAFAAAKYLTGWETWDERTLEVPIVDDMVYVANWKGEGPAWFGDWEIGTFSQHGDPM